MKALTKDTWRMIRQNLGNVLLFELLYRGVVFPVYMRLANRVLKWTLMMAGYSYLTASNLQDFLGRPWTIAAVFAAGLSGLLLMLVEAAALITAFQGSACQQKLTPFHIFWGGLHKTAEEISRGNWLLVLSLFPHYLLVNLLLIARCLSHIRPVNFVIQEMLAMAWVPFMTGIFLLGCALISFPGIFVGFGCMADGKKFSGAWKYSRRLLQGGYGRAAVLLVACNLTVAMAAVTAYLLSVFAAAVFVVLFAEKNLAMAVLLSVSERIERIVLYGGGILLVTADFAALAAMYYSRGYRGYSAKNEVIYPPRGSAAHGRIVGIGLVLLTAGLLYILDMVHHGLVMSDGLFEEIQITAHRGSSRSAPENTAAAVWAAMEEMADCVELDAQLTKDDVIVLGHDTTLKRVAGVNRAISSFTWRELSDLEVGSWFSPEFDGEPIPKLEDVMDLCRGKINLNIEIKNVGKDSLLPELVVGLILDKDMEEQCMVTSTSLGYLERVKLLAPEIRTGYILSAAYGDFYFNEKVDFISMRANFVNSHVVERAHERGMGVHAWTVNSKSEIERLRLLGVDGLITDYPVLAREIIYREEATETLLEYLRMVFR